MSSTGGKAAQTPHARYLGFREEIRQTEYRKEFKRRRNELIIAKEVRLQTNRHHDQEGRIVAMLVNKDVDYDTVNDFIRDKERGMSAELQRALLEHLLN